MAPAANGARGEVPLRAGGQDLVIAAEIGRLAAVSTALGCTSFVDLYTRLMGAEVATTIAAIRHLTVRGNGEAAAAALKLSDFQACRTAFGLALLHHIGDEPDAGKAGAAGEGAAAPATTSPSPGATG